MFTTLELATRVVAEAKRQEDLTHFEVDYIFGLVDVHGKVNEHLANPLNRYPNVYYFRERSEPLRGDEIVYGEFLILSYCSHDPSMKLWDYESITQLEQHILGRSGILNPFTTGMIAFINGNLARYEITYGCKIGSRKVFNKQAQLDSSAPFGQRYKNPKLRWEKRWRT